MIVAVNKMDEKTVAYSEKRHNEIETAINHSLKRTGFNPDTTPHVPISGFNGDNVIERSKNMPWDKGPTLLEALDNVQEPVSPVEKPYVILCMTPTRSRASGRSPSGVLRCVLKPGQNDGPFRSVRCRVRVQVG